MPSYIRFNIEVSPGRIVVLSLAVCCSGVAAYASEHTIADPHLSAWRPDDDVNDPGLTRPLPHEESMALAAAEGLIRMVEVSLNIAGGDGGWSEVTMEEEVERVPV
ncbi:hypothetical protein FA95DRAFT_1614252 [Auriscalpium vulgare]|uniref:Uncharacterized protein n=1 Tax=Auriscalpium vulgare TaxID=40419 RepID=A0ACB8QZW9_9AGAM|nr:hypothetical protein FA95DRAFT_1614252 [Auriscalpium vulgare]